MKTTLVLVRHAAPVLPTPGAADDHERPLTDVGLQQASALVPQLVGLSPAAVVSSPYRRAIQTVKPTADKLDLKVRSDWSLREWDSGLDVCADWADHYARSWADPALVRPGGESLEQLSRRAVEVLQRLMRHHRGQALIVGSHGTFISRALAGFGVSVDWAFSRDMPMSAIYHLSFEAADTPPVVAGPELPTTV